MMINMDGSTLYVSVLDSPMQILNIVIGGDITPAEDVQLWFGFSEEDPEGVVVKNTRDKRTLFNEHVSVSKSHTFRFLNFEGIKFIVRARRSGYRPVEFDFSVGTGDNTLMISMLRD